MTRDDRSQNMTTAGGRRSPKGKRTKGVGRTGARFPSSREEEPEEPPTPAPTTQPEPAQPSPPGPAPAPSPPAPSPSLTHTPPASPAQGASAYAARGQTSPAYGSPGHGSRGRGVPDRASRGHEPPVHESAGHALRGQEPPTRGSGQTSSAHPSSAHPSSAHAAAGHHSPEHGVPDHATRVRASSADASEVGAPAGGVASPAEGVDDGDDPGFAGRTGARFGPYSVRRPRRGREFDTGSTPAVDYSPVAALPGEPTPEQSAERTVPLIRPWAGALVRPYAHTGGRTRSSHVLAIEALISSSREPGVGDAVLTTHHRRMIVDLCAQPRSVAEVAALLSVPLGVARVLLGDLATAGVVVVHRTAGTSGDGEPDLEFMNRVLVGLRRL